MAKKTTGTGGNDGERRQLSEDEAKQVVDKLVQDATDQIGGDFPGAIKQVFDAALADAKAKRESGDASAPKGAAKGGDDNVVDLDAERNKRDGLSPFEQQVQAGLRDAFATYVNDKVVKPGGSTEINVDPQFLQEHGPALLGALVQGFVKAVVPPEIKVELNVPPAPGAAQDAAPKAASQDAKETPAAPGQQVTMKVDLGGLFRNLMKTPDAAPPAPQAEPNKDE